jgi:hypothetical protein
MDNEIEPIYKKFNYPSNVQNLLKNLLKLQVLQPPAMILKTFLIKGLQYNRPRLQKQIERIWGI